MTIYGKPLPDIAEPTMAPYWSAAFQHRFVVQQCTACSSYRWPPLPQCPECLEPTCEWIDAPLHGSIWSYVVYHRAFHPGFENDVPYAVAIVELDIGIRVEGALVDAPDKVAVGLPVVAVFDDVTPEITLIKWTLQRAAG
jgi:uncharacterized OB-fold protein